MVSITVPENYGYALSAFFTQLPLQCQCNLSIANINIIQRRHCRRPRRNTCSVMDPGHVVTILRKPAKVPYPQHYATAEQCKENVRLLLIPLSTESKKPECTD